MGEPPHSPRETVFRVIQPVYSSKLFCKLSVRIALVALLFLTTAHFFGPGISQSTFEALRPTSNNQHNKLHFLLPASSPDPNVFKAVVSSSILGYPIPSIINWASKASLASDNMNSPNRRARQLEKLFAVAQYLDSLQDVEEDDLLLMVDSLDTWFQLPPSILVSRYFEINARAQENIRARLGPEAAKNATQSIIFSAEKKCWPREAGDMGCWALPDPPLPRNIYGPLTDFMDKDESDEFRFMRPRYLNSGFVLGPVLEARTMFSRAAEIAHADPEVFGADQGIIAQIFGEQEYSRETGRTRNDVGREASMWKRGKMVDFKAAKDKNYEFGIGLDYYNALGVPTAHAENDSAWAIVNDKAALDKIAKAQGVTEPRARRGLQADITKMAHPFAGLDDSVPNEAKLKSWGDVPLYTNLWTGVTAATVHLNSIDKNDHKTMRAESWWKMWFAPYARELFLKQAAALEKSSSSEHLVAKQGKKEFYGTIPNEVVKERGFGAETIDKDGKRSWIRWTELCDEKDREEIFDSGKKQNGKG